MPPESCVRAPQVTCNCTAQSFVKHSEYTAHDLCTRSLNWELTRGSGQVTLKAAVDAKVIHEGHVARVMHAGPSSYLQLHCTELCEAQRVYCTRFVHTFAKLGAHTRLRPSHPESFRGRQSDSRRACRPSHACAHWLRVSRMRFGLFAAIRQRRTGTGHRRGTCPARTVDVCQNRRRQ